MKKWISVKLAGTILMASMILLVIFHVLVLLKVIPADIVWGGQIKGQAVNILTLEIIALSVTLLFTAIIAAKLNYIGAGILVKWVNPAVWIVFLYLILNTLGNLASGVSFENLIFAPITLVLALCVLRLAVEK